MTSGWDKSGDADYDHCSFEYSYDTGKFMYAKCITATYDIDIKFKGHIPEYGSWKNGSVRASGDIEYGYDDDGGDNPVYKILYQPSVPDPNN